MFRWCMNPVLPRWRFGEVLRHTFERRETALPDEIPIALTEGFSLDPIKQTQWAAFLRKSRLESDSLEEVIQRINTFLVPFCSSEKPDSEQRWIPGQGWGLNGEF